MGEGKDIRAGCVHRPVGAVFAARDDEFREFVAIDIFGGQDGG